MANTSPTIVGCCSFKGGAGRSTAAVNTAAALMSAGQNVLLLDMDFGAPGLHEILRVAGLDIYTAPLVASDDNSVLGLQHLFNEYREGRGFQSTKAKWILKNRVYPLRTLIAETATSTSLRDKILSDAGEIIFVPSSPMPPLSSWSHQGAKESKIRSEFTVRLQGLNDVVRRNLDGAAQFDFIVMDSASGMNAHSMPVHDLSHVLLVFYRHSVQHTLGTAWMARGLDTKRSLRPRWRGKSILCIPSCVEDRERLALAPKVREQLTKYESRAGEAMGNIPESFKVADHGLSIRDEVSLRMMERVMMFEEGMAVAEDFKAIAECLIAKRTGYVEGSLS